jgi:hypothetical protein
MKILIGGLVAAILGIVGIVVFWKQFLAILAGGVPLLLLLFGALAVYLGFEEVRDRFMEKRYEPSETEDYKTEVEKLKTEIEELKKAKVEKEEDKKE